MPYPQAPWTLKGYAIQALQLIDIEKARPLIPSELEIVSIWPGKTLGTVYISSYQSGSVMEYNELIVAPALVRYHNKIGAWISHIYVDNPDSVAGGREIWGLPKELADFTWENSENRVTVRQGNRLLCSLNYSQQSLALPIPLSADSFSSLNTDLLIFKAEFKSRLGLVSSKLEVPPESPFASLNLSQPLICVYVDDLHLVVDGPEVVGQRIPAYSQV